MQEGTKIGCSTSEYDLKQVINEQTHLLENSSSCIDLNFYISTKFNDGCRLPSVFTRKLSSSNSLCKT